MRRGQNQYALPVPMLSWSTRHWKRVNDLAHLSLKEINKHESAGLGCGVCAACHKEVKMMGKVNSACEDSTERWKVTSIPSWQNTNFFLFSSHIAWRLSRGKVVNIIINLDEDVSFLTHFLIKYLARIQINASVSHLWFHQLAASWGTDTDEEKWLYVGIYMEGRQIQSNLCIISSSTCGVNPHGVCTNKRQSLNYVLRRCSDSFK